MIQNKTRQQAEQHKQNNILKQEANKTKTKSKNQKLTWETGRKEERKEQERDKERECEKGGGQKQAKEKQRETQTKKQKCPFLWGKTGFFYEKQRKESKEKLQKTRRVNGQVKWPVGPPHLTLTPSKQKQKTNKRTKNKEGLGPSEVDPTTKQKQSKKQRNKT